MYLLYHETKGYLAIHHSITLSLRNGRLGIYIFIIIKGSVSNLHETFAAHKQLTACQGTGHFPSAELF